VDVNNIFEMKGRQILGGCFILMIAVSCGKERERVTPEILPQEIKAECVKKAGEYIEQKEFFLAEKEIKRALEIDPYDYKLYYALGYVYDQTERNEEAVMAYITALRLDPERKRDAKGTFTHSSPFSRTLQSEGIQKSASRP
jgi:Tfp pilus assembly protein PilF